MTFRASNQIQADGLIEAKRIVNRMVLFATQNRDLMAAGDVSGNLVLQVQTEFHAAILRWNDIKAIPGIAQYAKDQEDDQNYDVVTEFNTMVNAASAVRDRVESDIPTAAGGWMNLQKFEADHTISTRAFTPAQTTQLRTDLDAFIATVS